MQETLFSLDYPVIDAHMHPYLAADRNFAFEVPQNFEDFFECSFHITIYNNSFSASISALPLTTIPVKQSIRILAGIPSKA